VNISFQVLYPSNKDLVCIHLFQFIDQKNLTMKLSTGFAILFACLIGASMFIEQTEASKKKILRALLAGAALAASKPKLLPLPLPIPVSLNINGNDFVNAMTIQ